MMGPPEGASEYLNLYDSLCDARAASGEEYAGLIPRGADSGEKVLRWHLRRRHVTADPWLLFNFVFYRVRSEFPFEVRVSFGDFGYFGFFLVILVIARTGNLTDDGVFCLSTGSTRAR